MKKTFETENFKVTYKEPTTRMRMEYTANIVNNNKKYDPVFLLKMIIESVTSTTFPNVKTVDDLLDTPISCTEEVTQIQDKLVGELFPEAGSLKK